MILCLERTKLCTVGWCDYWLYMRSMVTGTGVLLCVCQQNTVLCMLSMLAEAWDRQDVAVSVRVMLLVCRYVSLVA
jgi:hypothetical protein